MEALLSPELLYKMEDRGLSLQRLYDMSASEIGAFLRHPAAGGWCVEGGGGYGRVALWVKYRALEAAVAVSSSAKRARNNCHCCPLLFLLCFFVSLCAVR